MTYLQVELTDELIEILGYKKPFLGRVEILLSVNVVKAIADVVGLTKAIAELKNLIEPSK